MPGSTSVEQLAEETQTKLQLKKGPPAIPNSVIITALVYSLFSDSFLA